MKKMLIMLVVINLFFAGFVLGTWTNFHTHPSLDVLQTSFATSNVAPQTDGEQLQEAVKNSLLSFFSDKAPERASPADRIKEKNIHVLNDKVILDIKEPLWAKFTNTNSMDPVLDDGANAIEISPKNPEDIKVGDIVSYSTGDSKYNIIHRVIKISKDKEGIYFIVKGDNNPSPDPSRIRFNQIKRIVVAIIY